MKKSKIGYFIIASAIIWGAVMIGASIVLKGTPYKEEISKLLMGGSVFHLLFIWGPMGAHFKNKKTKQDIDKKNSE